MSTENDRWVSITVKPETKERVRLLKRGGISYDQLLQNMVDAYEAEVDDL